MRRRAEGGEQQGARKAADGTLAGSKHAAAGYVEQGRCASQSSSCRGRSPSQLVARGPCLIQQLVVEGAPALQGTFADGLFAAIPLSHSAAAVGLVGTIFKSVAGTQASGTQVARRGGRGRDATTGALLELGGRGHCGM